MPSTNPEEILSTLEHSAERLLDSVRDVSDTDAHAKPLSDRWSIIENVEHLATVERLFGRRIPVAEKRPEPFFNEGRAAAIYASAQLREPKFQAPEAVRPTGKHATLRDALAEFALVRQHTADLVREHTGDLPFFVVSHPVVGEISGVEACYLIAAHTLRHVNQIQEIKALIGSGLQSV